MYIVIAVHNCEAQGCLCILISMYLANHLYGTCVCMLHLHITESLLELSNFLLSLSYLPLALVLGKRRTSCTHTSLNQLVNQSTLICNLQNFSSLSVIVTAEESCEQSYHLLIGALILFKLFKQLVILAIIFGNLLSIILQQLSGWTEVAYRRE